MLIRMENVAHEELIIEYTLMIAIFLFIISLPRLSIQLPLPNPTKQLQLSRIGQLESIISAIHL